MTKPPAIKTNKVKAALTDKGAYFVRQGGEHEIWRCQCGQHQTSVPRHGTVSSYVVGQIGKQMPCLGKEWWK